MAQACSPGNALESTGMPGSDLTQAQAPAQPSTDGASAPAPDADPARACPFPARPDLSGPTTNERQATPGATYQEGVTPQDLKAALDEQACYAREQWAAGRGVVGPKGQEGGWLYSGYNDPTDPNFASYQAFAYQHDMQGTDAQLQEGVPQAQAYEQGLTRSAVVGMGQVEGPETVSGGLTAARDVWRELGFDVRLRY